MSSMGQGQAAMRERRRERRIAVHLPMQVRGKDFEGAEFEESTRSENLCRGGAAFVLRRKLGQGTSLEIRIPLPAPDGASEDEFSTVGRVVHMVEAVPSSSQLVGVEFIGPRFRRIFQTEDPNEGSN